ncbi:MAG TPA: DUF3090 family protein [Egibacteraceae bacterium]|nr:DUF3090 family protein [Egibacteraceae bacterium]
MGESFELDVDWITAGAVGEPGRRTFYVQGRQGGELVVLLVEKNQVRMLAQLAAQLLSRVDVAVTPDDLDTARQALVDPAVPAWRAGTMSLGMEADGERFLLEAEELMEPEAVGEAGTARFWMNRDQLVGLAAYAAYAVEAGARETCRLCSRPIDPISGHVCPASNGHGPLTV